MTKYRVEVNDKNTRWYKWGTNELHREDGPAIKQANGTESWYLDGKHHRENGPAIEWANGSESWYLNGKYHREDGPAIEWGSGSRGWYLNGERFSEKEWRQRVNNHEGKTVEIDGVEYELKKCGKVYGNNFHILRQLIRRINMTKTIGVLAIVGALACGYLMFRGSLDVEAEVTKQGKQEISDVRNSLADKIRDKVVVGKE